jgi:hypothetical protein
MTARSFAIAALRAQSTSSCHEPWRTVNSTVPIGDELYLQSGDAYPGKQPIGRDHEALGTMFCPNQGQLKLRSSAIFAQEFPGVVRFVWRNPK